MFRAWVLGFRFFGFRGYMAKIGAIYRRSYMGYVGVIKSDLKEVTWGIRGLSGGYWV